MSEASHFVVYTIDAPGRSALRARLRPDHIAFIKSLAPRVKVGGPLLDHGTGESEGGMYVLEAMSLDEARSTAMQDPYVREGVSGSVNVREWRWQTGNPGPERDV